MDNEKQSVSGEKYYEGQLVGDLKLIEKSEKPNRWIVECLICNNIYEETLPSLSRIRKDNLLGCKKCRERKKFSKKYKQGMIIACYELIDIDGGNYWNVKCVHCGKVQKQSVSNMNRKKTDKCMYCDNPNFIPNYNGGGLCIKYTLDHIHYNSYKNKVLKNNSIETKKFKEWSLTEDEFIKLIHSDCKYCGEKPTIDNQWNKANKRKSADGMYAINGIDRVDADKGYSYDNCVPCCSICNIMKHDFKYNDFISHIQKILIHSKCSTTSLYDVASSDGETDGTLASNVEGYEIV